MSEEMDLESRQLMSFSSLYAAVWDLYARQAEVRQLLVDMNEEFTLQIPRSRLVLYLKRKDTSFEYSALHWGFTIPGLRSSPSNARGHRVRRIKHVSTPLNDAVIHCGAGDGRRKLFFDFDRRRLAANGAYKKVTKTITTIRQTLKARAGRAGGAAPEAPLPRGGDPGGMPPEALETVRLGWTLLSSMLDREIELLRLAREVEIARTDSRVKLAFTFSSVGSDCANAHWTLAEAPLEKLTYAQIRALRIPEAHQKRLSMFERSRREIMKALAKSQKVFEKLMDLPVASLERAHQGVLEARRREVDGFGRPIPGTQDKVG